jgi:hypothetical protein
MFFRTQAALTSPWHGFELWSDIHVSNSRGPSMGNRTFSIMAVVFLVLGATYWWFNLGPGRADGGSVARSLSVQEAWPDAVQMVRPTLRGFVQTLESSGVPRSVAGVLVVGGVLLAGYITAWVILRLVVGLFTSASLIAGFFQVIVAPLWQIGLTLVSAMQTVEWIREKGWISADVTTPAFIVFAIISLAMMYGLSKVRSADD